MSDKTPETFNYIATRATRTAKTGSRRRSWRLEVELGKGHGG